MKRNLLKGVQKNKFVCFNEIIRLIIRTIYMKMKNRDQLDTTNRPMSRYVLKYTKYYNTLLITTFYK